MFEFPDNKQKYTENPQVLPAFSLTKMLLAPLFITPTKIRGVAVPVVPDVESNVTQERPVKNVYDEFEMAVIERVPPIISLL